ncbi:hypothetical protein Bbelb_014910 [Branchiostoma belcheri]|nr:hypothetical protein Bbelb_014910 [Branchiostoma belcheri]
MPSCASHYPANPPRSISNGRVAAQEKEEKSCRMKLAAHCVRHPDIIESKLELVLGEPTKGQRSRGRPRINFIDNLRSETSLTEVKEIQSLMEDKVKSNNGETCDLQLTRRQPKAVIRPLSIPADVSEKDAVVYERAAHTINHDTSSSPRGKQLVTFPRRNCTGFRQTFSDGSLSLDCETKDNEEAV